jgi:L-amino acid N-acyltransferase YncA
MSTFSIREANVADISALARLHVTTFNETHAQFLKNGPTYAIRERQWRDSFQITDGSSFCLVVVDMHGHLLGFAKGVSLRARGSSRVLWRIE